MTSRTDDFGQASFPAPTWPSQGSLSVAHHSDDTTRPVRPPRVRQHLDRRHDDQAYDQVKVYMITDRPVYRPGQPVRFKFWVARSRYDQPNAIRFRPQDRSPSRSTIPKVRRS